MAARYPEDSEKYLQENQANHKVESKQDPYENVQNGDEENNHYQEQQSIKHPLGNRWTLWYYKKDPKKE